MTYGGADAVWGAGSNRKTDLSYPVAVVLLSVDGGGPAGGGEDVGTSPAVLRELVGAALHDRRLPGCPEVLYCRVSPGGRVADAAGALYSDLRATVTVTAYARRAMSAD